MTRGDSGTDARFAALSDSLRALARRGELKRYRKGTVLIEENERGETLFIILSGRLKAYATDHRGARSPTASTARASTSAR